ncbi:tRNA (adenosine(37)-N6)-dimethylallyltransferase MiaA [Candidatus Methylacidithermus pantelleriae]|uniref:tRNA dimethylallyltransferase n=1 Tax=Candidatus Methylacidithermus pantelleriae TaxID=2744239 RepID=A0A8J2BPS7_9BACT|nr:tRNA (adenosine(37)-N6)-dimethylallyltransferase MiaA [Candidatus Methylacidithermus pantelleriae]CAF0697482.1 tRNA dimethylallyltransferase [Candidatus Methylacidithermus pantelleriae]
MHIFFKRKDWVMAQGEDRPLYPPFVWFLVGATATGKSEVAFLLAQKLGAAILSLDSMQVYRGLDIGTAKPSAEQRAQIPHGGIDLVDWWESWSVGHFVTHASWFLEEQAKQGRGVIAVGGTGLYFRALTRGLCGAPAPDPQLRRMLEALPEEERVRRLWIEDPKAAQQIDLANPRRVLRALEVKLQTGISLLDWQKTTTKPRIQQFRAIWLDRRREELKERISTRVQRLLAEGWIEEVQGLVKEGGYEAVENCPAIGYREIARWLKEGGTLSRLQEAIARRTWQYARRQLTWFRQEVNVGYRMMERGEEPAKLAESLRLELLATG